MPSFSVDEAELEAMLGAHRDRHGALRIAAARLSTSCGARLKPEDVQVVADPDENRVTFSWPDPEPLYTMTFDIVPDRTER